MYIITNQEHTKEQEGMIIAAANLQGIGWRSGMTPLSNYQVNQKHTASAGTYWGADTWDCRTVIVASTTEFVSAARAIGELDDEMFYDKNVLIVPPEMFDNSATADDAEYIVSHGNVLFDCRKDKSSLCTIKEHYEGTRYYVNVVEYKGNDYIDDDLAYVYCRNIFLDIIEHAWNESFVIRPRDEAMTNRPNQAKKEQNLRTIARSSVFADLLLLDRGNFNVFEKKGKVPAWKSKALQPVHIPANAFSPKMQKTYQEVARLNDIVKFWQRSADDYGWALRLSTRDLEKDKIDKTKEKIAKMAELIDLESYLNAYDAGVSASDLLA